MPTFVALTNGHLIVDEDKAEVQRRMDLEVQRRAELGTPPAVYGDWIGLLARNEGEVLVNPAHVIYVRDVPEDQHVVLDVAG